jgi:hypothetical protein
LVREQFSKTNYNFSSAGIESNKQISKKRIKKEKGKERKKNIHKMIKKEE